MSLPIFKDYNTILDEMMNDLAGKGTNITDMNPGSIIRTLLEIGAVKFDEADFTAEQILDLFFVATTTGEYLDRRANERGLTRSAGIKATGNITVGRSTPAPFSELIPMGTVFETEDHSVQVQTTTEGTLLEGESSTTLPVTAAAVGKSGNLQPGVVLKQTGVAVNLIETVTVADPGLAGGTDIETDDVFRARYLTVLRSPGTSGNKADYKKWAMEITGVGGVDVTPTWNGGGTVKVSLLGTDKTPAATDVVTAVQVYIDPEPQGQGNGTAPVGAVVTCVAAPAVEINVSATMTIDSSTTLDAVKASVETGITNYLKEIAFSNDTTVTVRYSYIGSVLHDTAGVIDYSNLTINYGIANVVIPKGSVAVKGTVTLA